MMFRFLVLGLSLAPLSMIACGGSTAGGSGNGVNGSGSCSVVAGTYTEHLVAEAGGTNCPAIPDVTVTIGSNETSMGGGTGSGSPDAGCSVNYDGATCTSTTSCTTTVNGFTSTIEDTFTFDGTSGSGKETIEDADSTGKVLSSCTYDVTITKN